MPTFLGTDLPIMQAPIGRAGGVDLVLAVSRAGGLGTLGAAYLAPDELRRQIRTTQRGTDAAFCVNLILAFDQAARVEVVAEEKVPWLSLSWGLDATLIARAQASGTRVLVQVSSMTDARAAVDAGADGLVVQGIEAGGHVQSSVALRPLLTQLRTVSVPLVAAGGIADVAGAADAFAAGAHAVAMGTRFVASDESLAHPRYRQRLIDATGADTVLTDLFDSGSPPWSAPHRVIRNHVFDAWDAAGQPPSGQRPEEDVPVAQVLVGDLVVVRPGERVPVDGVVEDPKRVEYLQGHFQAAEKAIIETIKADYPDHFILSEEVGEMATGSDTKSTPAVEKLSLTGSVKDPSNVAIFL